MALERKLMLPTNWDPDLLTRVSPLQPAYLYGALPDDPSLRNSLYLPQAEKDQIEDYIAAMAEAGIKFIYVMNATCLGNREMSEHGRFEILQRCQWVLDSGGAGIVTANPFVMELIKQHMPQLEVHVSVLAYVNQPRNAVFYEGIGADVIHLDPVVNRDFKKLRAIRQAVDCTLSLLVNEGCTILCPIRNYHANVMSHSAESIAGRFHVDYCYYKCSLHKTTDTAEYVRIPWIRPEDVDIYLDAGVDLLKLAGREKMGGGPSSHTDWIVAAAEAYATGRPADIAELMVAIDGVDPLTGPGVESPRVHIDSTKLDGFLKFFEEGKCDFNCTRCRYCEDWAEVAVTLDGDPAPYVAQTERTLQRVRLGSYWTGE